MTATALAALLTVTAGLVQVSASPAAAAPAAPAAPVGDAAPASAPAIERVPAPKRAKTTLTAGDSREFIHVKFAEGSAVRLRAGRLAGRSAADLAAVEKVLDAGSVAQVAPLFRLDEAVLDDRARRATALSGRKQADLNLWFRLRLKPGADPVAVIGSLNALSVVETAYPEPLPVRPPLAPDFRSLQGYRSPASANGVDADFARTVPGGTGADVRVVDIEYAWNTGHEDLSKLRLPGTMIPNGTPWDPFVSDGSGINHGTAVVGQLSGDDNGGGVLGLVPDAQLHTTNAANFERGWDLGNSISVASGDLRPGDVILLEQQAEGPTGCGLETPQFVPVEWIPAFYDAIVAATSLGIVVVEAAGNGGQDLDNTCLYGSPFPSGRPDSGAIIVGAGGAPGCSSSANVRARLGFSTYGNRVDLQGWGECVTTTGWYGSLHGTTPDTWYANDFGGTSGASPIVTAAAASLSSIAKHRGLLLTPRDVRSRLTSTGTPQQNLAGGKIGPLPNLRAAIGALPATAWTASASSSASGLPPSNAIDGSTTTRWSNGRGQASGQFVQLDFRAPKTFNRLVLDAGSAQASQYPRRWEVRVSSNGTSWGSPIATGTGSGQRTTISVPTTTARYVRVILTGSSSSQWSIADLGVSTA